ncbi:Odorant receptor 432 [Nylanderia fulva]|uniref:Odorant receptor 432 n=1 Tax=Nylanderia fulva TaxID=613905 RepID=A0A6G1LP52_9HYME|nr:Odorant receptor 432 [Nylanderia fulva]
MICIKTQHFNRVLLLAIDYQKSKFVRLQTIMFFIIQTSFIIFQVPFINTRCILNFILNVLLSVIFSSFSVRNLLDQLQYICNKLKDEKEIAVIRKYGTFAERWIIIFTSNKIEIEYFIGQKKYFYLLLLHIDSFICIGLTTLASTSTIMFLGYIMHICGMFKIASCMDQAMPNKIIENIKMKNNMIYKEIIDTIEIPRQAMKLIDFFISTFEGSVLSLIPFSVISLNLNIFSVSILLFVMFITLLLSVSAVLSHMFVTNYAGYNSRWYIALLHLQKLIHFILQRDSKNFNLNIAGMFEILLECFGMIKIIALQLIKSSMSYFTVIYSMQ